MTPRWWTIAKMELTLALRDREALIWSLIAPIAMAAIFGAMFGGNDAPLPTKVTIVEEVVAGNLAQRGFVVGDNGIRVQLPDSLLDRMIDGRGATARVVKKDESDTRTMAVSAAVREG